MSSEETIRAIEQLVESYDNNIGKIVQVYQLSTSRIVYHVARMYNKFPDIVPCEYRLQVNELLDDECRELLERLSYKVWYWRLDCEQDRAKGLYKIWTNGTGLYSFRNQMHYQVVIDFYYDTHSDTIVKAKLLHPTHREMKEPGCFLLLPMLVMVEDKIIDILMRKINEALGR